MPSKKASGKKAARSAPASLHMFTAYNLDDALSERYTIGKRLGKGSFGTVHSAIEKATNEKYAIKTMKLLDDGYLEMSSVTEVSLLARLSHPNIIRMKEVDCDFKAKKMALVLELADSDLAGYINDWSEESPGDDTVNKQRIEFAHQILCGLNYLHSNEILHLDLKPQNILVKNSECKIADFGLSERLFAERTSGAAIGTWYYEAPEMVCGCGDYSFASDIWSIGVIFCEMFLDINPFRFMEDEKQTIKYANDASRLFAYQQALLGGAPTAEWSKTYQGSQCSTLPREKVLSKKNIKSDFRKWMLATQGKNGHLIDRFNLIIDMISKCFAWEPTERATAYDLMQHELFSEKAGMCHNCASGCVIVKGYHIPPNGDKPLLPELEELMEESQQELGHIEYRILVYSREIYQRYLERSEKKKNNPTVQSLINRMQKVPVIVQQIACLCAAAAILGEPEDWMDREDLLNIFYDEMPAEVEKSDLVQLELQMCQILEFNLDGPFAS